MNYPYAIFPGYTRIILNSNDCTGEHITLKLTLLSEVQAVAILITP